MTVTRRESTQETIDRLTRFVRRHERRYETTSEQMVEWVQSGVWRETAEIGEWLTKYRALRELQAHQASKRTTGTRTTHT